VKVTAGETADCSGQHKSQNNERHRQSVKNVLEMEMKVLFVNGHSVADFDRYITDTESEHHEQNRDESGESDDHRHLGQAKQRAFTQRASKVLLKFIH